MASVVTISGLDKAAVRMLETRQLRRLGAAAYKYPLETGLSLRLRSVRWRPNAASWVKRKGNNQPWVRTGRTMNAITNNPIRQGKRGGYTSPRGIRFSVNRRNSQAYIFPMTFGGPLEKQREIYQALQFGSNVRKIYESWRKNRGRERGFNEYLESASGVSTRLMSIVAKGKYSGIPARPLFKWMFEWEPEMRRDVEQAVGEIFSDADYIVSPV